MSGPVTATPKEPGHRVAGGPQRVWLYTCGHWVLDTGDRPPFTCRRCRDDPPATPKENPHE